MKIKDAPAGVASIVDQAVRQTIVIATSAAVSNVRTKIFNEDITDEFSSCKLAASALFCS